MILHLGTTAAILLYHRKSIVQGWRGLSAPRMSHPAFSRADVIHVGVLAAVATSPLVPFALFFKKPLEKTFEGDDSGRLRIPGHGGGAAAHRMAEPAGRGQRGRRRRTGGCPLDRNRPDVRPAARGQPQRCDDRRRARSRAVANLGGRLQPADRGPGELGAVVFEIKDVKPSMLTFDRVGPAVAGTVVAAIVGYFAIIWLTRVVRSGRIWCFSLYLVVLAIVVLCDWRSAELRVASSI